MRNMQDNNNKSNPFWIGITSPFWIIALRVFIALATIYVAWRIQLILVSITIAVILTYIMLPAVDWLSMHILIPKKCDEIPPNNDTQKKRPKLCLRYSDRRLIATIVVFFGFMAILIIASHRLFAPFQDEVADFRKNSHNYVATAKTQIGNAFTLYEDAVPKPVRDWIDNLDKRNLVDMASGYLQRMLKFVMSSVGIVLELFLIPVLAFYFLLDYRSITSEIYGAVPRRRLRDALRIGRRLGEILQSYVIGQLILCTIAGVLTGLFLWALHMPYILVLALFAAITRAIPVIGPVVSGIPIILVGLVCYPQSYVPLVLLAFITTMHFAESKFVMPKLIGDRLHLRPAVVIIVLLIGAEFFGLIGMFLAAPVTAIIRDIIRYYYILPRRSKQVNPMGER